MGIRGITMETLHSTDKPPDGRHRKRIRQEINDSSGTYVSDNQAV